jgi:hypothetical protein
MNRTIRALGPSLLPALLLAACGPQVVADGTTASGDCARIAPRLSDTELTAALGCWAQSGSPEAITECRAVAAFVADVSPEGLRTAAECILSTGERTDGAFTAELMNARGTDPAVMSAMVQALVAAFDESRHANSFTTALASAAQTTIGQNLGNYGQAERDLMVSLGLSYAMSPLDSFCLPYARTLPPGHPGLQTLAANVPQDGRYDSDERWAMAASGSWDGTDLVECYEREQRGCAEWDGQSPLELFSALPAPEGASPHPGNAARLLSRAELRPEEASAVVRWLLSADYTNQDMIAGDLLQMVTNPEAFPANRLAIAREATGPLCNGENLRTMALRLSTEDLRPEPDNSAWPVLVAACAPNMDAANGLRTLAAGAKLVVSDLIANQVRAQLQTLLEDVACNEVFAMADDIRQSTQTSPTSAIVYAEAMMATGNRCVSEFSDTLSDVIRDRSQHPHTRIVTAQALLLEGDRSGCNNISAMLNWEDEQTGFGPGAVAEERAEQLRSACGD